MACGSGGIEPSWVFLEDFVARHSVVREVGDVDEGDDDTPMGYRRLSGVFFCMVGGCRRAEDT